MAIDLYEMEFSPPCRAVMLLARYLGIELNRKHIDLLAKEQLKPEFLKLNPQHQVPLIVDNGFVLAESGAILTYLCNKYAPDSSLYPKDPQERAVVERMLHFLGGTLFKAQGEIMRSIIFANKVAGAEKYEAYHQALKILEEFLSKTPYAAGNKLTIADLQIFPLITMAEVFNIDFADYPKISAWVKKLRAEIPCQKELNQEPLERLKEIVKAKNVI